MTVLTNSYWAGTTVRLYAEFRVDDVLTDPTSVAFSVISPDGTRTDYDTPTNPSTGVYTQDVVPDAEGMWTWNVEGTGSAQAVEEHHFIVKDSAFA